MTWLRKVSKNKTSIAPLSRSKIYRAVTKEKCLDVLQSLEVNTVYFLGGNTMTTYYSPWFVQQSFFPSRSKKAQSDGAILQKHSQITCAECPGGQRCDSYSRSVNRGADYEGLLHVHEPIDKLEDHV
jgi:hypothetical protein